LKAPVDFLELRYAEGGRKKYWLPKTTRETPDLPDALDRGMNRVLGRVAHGQEEDVYAPLLENDAEDVVHLAPDLQPESELSEEGLCSGIARDDGDGPSSVLQPLGVYTLDWRKTPAIGSNGRPTVRLAAGSITDDFRNQIAILGPRDERVLVEDDADGGAELVILTEASHRYPARCLHWQPGNPNGAGWSAKGPQNAELLATTGDFLRVWNFAADQSSMGSSYVGRPDSGSQYTLTTKHTLQWVSLIHHSAKVMSPSSTNLTNGPTFIDEIAKHCGSPSHLLLLEQQQPISYCDCVGGHDMHRVGHRGWTGRHSTHRS
jgi:hypothetical protein